MERLTPTPPNDHQKGPYQEQYRTPIINHGLQDNHSIPRPTCSSIQVTPPTTGYTPPSACAQPTHLRYSPDTRNQTTFGSVGYTPPSSTQATDVAGVSRTYAYDAASSPDHYTSCAAGATNYRATPTSLQYNTQIPTPATLQGNQYASYTGYSSSNHLAQIQPNALGSEEYRHDLQLNTPSSFTTSPTSAYGQHFPGTEYTPSNQAFADQAGNPAPYAPPTHAFPHTNHYRLDTPLCESNLQIQAPTGTKRYLDDDHTSQDTNSCSKRRRITPEPLSLSPDVISNPIQEERGVSTSDMTSPFATNSTPNNITGPSNSFTTFNYTSNESLSCTGYS